MKYVIKNDGAYPLKLLVRTGYDRSSDADPTNNGLEDVVVPVGGSYTIDDDHKLMRMAELTPTPGSPFMDVTYGGSGGD